MWDHQPSSTAIFVNQLRAEHQLADAEPKILVDPVVVDFARLFQNATALDAFAEMSQASLDMLRSTLVCRSRFVEDTLRDFAAQEFCQYGLLGAGFDTFAYRRPAWAEEIPIFEIDHPMTQAAKRAVLEDAGCQIPPNVHFCQIDFQTQTLREALSPTPFAFDTPTVFSWMGVTQYITHAAFRATLDFVLSLPRSTTIVFSFIATDDVLNEDDRAMVVDIEGPVAVEGEPWISRYNPIQLKTLLCDMGFSDVFHLAPETAQEQYFGTRTDRLEAPRVEQLIRATV